MVVMTVGGGDEGAKVVVVDDVSSILEGSEEPSPLLPGQTLVVEFPEAS